VEMPKMNGYQLCEKIKQDPRTNHIPVLLLAGAFEPIDDELAKKVGADDSIIKPFESQELISKLNAVLTMASAEEAGEAVAAEPEEAVEVMEEAGDEAVEMTGAEEDLWAMEEIPESSEELAAEALMEEEPSGIEDAFEMPEEVPAEPAAEPFKTVRPSAAAAPVGLPEVAMPSREEVLGMVRKAVDEKVSALLSGVDIREVFLSSLTPAVRDSAEKVLWEIAPELGEKVLKEILRDSVSSIGKEVEKVIWETVPDLAGAMISKEIEKIRSEY
jgi:YesN/AraC family two-component response regulator